MNSLQTVYPKDIMAETSTSFGLICLLHSANDKGLLIENTVGWVDLLISKNFEHEVLESVKSRRNPNMGTSSPARSLNPVLDP